MRIAKFEMERLMMRPRVLEGETGGRGDTVKRRKGETERREKCTSYRKSIAGLELGVIERPRIGRIAQGESTCLTSRGSEVRNLLRPPR